jgi:hypothetical protein
MAFMTRALACGSGTPHTCTFARLQIFLETREKIRTNFTSVLSKNFLLNKDLLLFDWEILEQSFSSYLFIIYLLFWFPLKLLDFVC